MTSLEHFQSLSPHAQGMKLLNLPRRKFEQLVKQLSHEDLVLAISFLDPSQATDVLRKIKSHHHREKIIAALNSDVQEKINFLFRFNPNTAGGVMDINYITIEKKDTLESIKKRIKRYEKQTGKIPTVLLMTEEKLHGEIPHHVLLLEKNLIKHVHKLPTIHHAEKTDAIVKQLKSHANKKAVVVDDTNNILGILYSDDLIHLLEKQRANGLYDFAGVHDEEDVFDPIRSKVRHRYRWLIINLFTAYLAAYVVSLFQETLSTYVLLAAYMPIVAGMGGNAGTQTLAVMVRSIALGEIELKNSLRALFHEVSAGFLNGIITGSVVACIAILWNHDPILGLVTGTAIVINLIVAGFFGALIPLVMKKLGKDPATSATIFITTATDVLGFFTFLGLATLLLV